MSRYNSEPLEWLSYSEVKWLQYITQLFLLWSSFFLESEMYWKEVKWDYVAKTTFLFILVVREWDICRTWC